MTTIEGFFSGDDLDIERDVTGITVSDPLIKAWLTIKTAPSVADAQATIQKVITTIQVIGTGQITQDGSALNGNGTASMVFNLTAVNTALLGTGRKYYFDVQVKTLSDKVYTPDKGTIQLTQGITDATS